MTSCTWEMRRTSSLDMFALFCITLRKGHGADDEVHECVPRDGLTLGGYAVQDLHRNVQRHIRHAVHVRREDAAEGLGGQRERGFYLFLTRGREALDQAPGVCVDCPAAFFAEDSEACAA